MFYAAHNTRADLMNGDQGFLNTWEISRFANRADRDTFVAKHDNKKAKPVSRVAAAAIFAGCYLSVGEDVPRGGLFGEGADQGRFWNEAQES